MSESGLETMEQNSVGSVPALPDSVSEGFPLMEGDTDDIPRSEETHPPAALEEPEDKLEKLLGSFEDKKRSEEAPAPQGNYGKQTLKKDFLEHMQGNGFSKRSPVPTVTMEEEEEQARRSPVKRPAPVKTVRINLPVSSPKKYPSILSKLPTSQPKKPALQAIINDLRKEIEKENDTSKIDLPASGLAKTMTPSGVKRKYPSENAQERTTPVTAQLPAMKRPRPFGEKPPMVASLRSGQKSEFLQMKQHKQVLSDVMKEMSQSGMHTDTTMIAGGQKISVHRLVLAASSSFLKSVLADQPGDATIILPETPYEDLAMLIDYAYCGESVVPEDRLSVILHLMSVLGFNPPIYSIRKGKTVPKTTARPTPRPVGVPPETPAATKVYTGAGAPISKPAIGPRPVPKKVGAKGVEEDPLSAAVRQIDDQFNSSPDLKVGSCWIRHITKQEAQAPRKKAIGRKIEVRPDKPTKTVIKLKEPFDRHKPRKVVIQRLDGEGGKTDDVNAALALTSLGSQPQQHDSHMSEDLDTYQEGHYQEGAYPESMLNSLLNTDQGGTMSMPSLDPEPLPEGKAEDELHGQEGAYMLEDGTIIQGGAIEGLPITTEGSDGTTYILVMDENQENLDLNQVIQGLSGGTEGNQAMLRIEEDGTVSYAATEDQADGGMYAAGDEDNGLAYTGMPESFDGQHFEGQEYNEGYDLEVKPKI